VKGLLFGLKFVQLGLEEFDFFDKGIDLEFGLGGGMVLSVGLREFGRESGGVELIGVGFRWGSFVLVVVSLEVMVSSLEVQDEGFVVLDFLCELEYFLLELGLAVGDRIDLIFELCDLDILLVELWVEVKLLLFVLFDALVKLFL
jgi:hypothetical protein